MNTKLGIALACALNLAAGSAVGVAVDRRCHFGPGFGPGGPHGPGGPQGGMAQSLGLSPEQDERVHAILDKHRPEFDAIRDDEAKRMSAVRDKTDEELRTVLDAEQYKKLLELRREIERHDQGGHGPPPHGPPPH
jgi:Spy/CpxP family protein refolding chaperone